MTEAATSLAAEFSAAGLAASLADPTACLADLTACLADPTADPGGSLGGTT